MLNVFSGPFSPFLEEKLLEKIDGFKGDPFTPLLIIAPSQSQIDYLQKLIAQKNQSILSLHFHTFSSLIQEISQFEKPLDKPIYSDSLFYDVLVKQIIRDDKPFEPAEDLAMPDGYPPAVRNTFKDLMEAGIPADVGMMMTEAFREELIQSRLDLGQILDLFRLYRIYLKKIESLPVYYRSILFEVAKKAIPTSGFLKNFREIIFYGFYDMTGVQSEILEVISKSFPASFFFPYIQNNPSFSFAKKFRDDFLHKLIQTEESASSTPTVCSDISVVNVSGLLDEAWFVAREIQKVHETKGIRYEDMAIVGRNQHRLGQIFPDVLSSFKIPFRSSFKNTIEDSPLFVLLCKWIRLLSQDKNYLIEPSSQLLQLLNSFETKDLLIGELTAWPEEATWSEWSTLLGNFFGKIFNTSEIEESQIYLDNIKSLATFDLLGIKVNRKEFFDIVLDKWSRIEIPVNGSLKHGVSLLHAEASRGLTFKLVFLVGVEEKVFPRQIHEDPFLRDEARIPLFNMLGYRIPPRLAGLDEEKLLFHLIVHSAKEKLVFVYQRTDEEGKVVGMSPFLRAFIEESKLGENHQIISRSYAEKLKTSSPQYLSSIDMMNWYVSQGYLGEAVQFSLDYFNPKKNLSANFKFVQSLESFSDPGKQDAILDPSIIERTKSLSQLSATSLETYHLCPYQFFGKDILRLRKVEDDNFDYENIEERLRGKIIHSFLKDFYTQAKLDSADLENQFNSLFDQLLPLDPSADIKIYPLLWEAHRRELRIILWQMISRDVNALKEKSLSPTYFEKVLTGVISEIDPKIVFNARIDRIDLGKEEARIVDYKSGKAKAGDISKLISEGSLAQPSIYLLMLQNFLNQENPDIKKLWFSYFYLKGEIPTKELTSSGWAEIKADTLKNIQEEIVHIKEGKFPIRPSARDEGYCSYCEINQICRKHDSISVYRTLQADSSVEEVS